MKEFKDKANRSWSIDVNGATITRVQSLTGILLTELIGGTAGQSIVEDPVKIMHVLYACCKPEATDRNVDEPAFLAGLSGDALDDAVNALIDEVVSFFPKSRRTMAQKLVDKGKEVQAEVVRRVTKTLEETTAEKLLDAVRGNSSGNSPASSASTPEVSHSAT